MGNRGTYEKGEREADRPSFVEPAEHEKGLTWEVLRGF